MNFLARLTPSPTYLKGPSYGCGAWGEGEGDGAETTPHSCCLHQNSMRGDRHGKDKLANSNSVLVKSECFGIVLYSSDKHDSELLF